MYFARLAPAMAESLSQPNPRSNQHSTPRGTAAMWIGAAVSAVVLAVLSMLAIFVATSLWIVVSLVASIAIYYVGGMVVLRRWHTSDARADVPADKRERYERMRRAHAAQVAGIARATGDRDAADMEALLAQIELRWSGLTIEHAELAHEEGRLRADHPWTQAQRESIDAMAIRRELIAEQADELEKIGRSLPGRVAVLAGVSYLGGMDRDGLHLAMLEAQLQVDSVGD
jgi:hypothetical protein